jgi:hypothetical protein
MCLITKIGKKKYGDMLCSVIVVLLALLVESQEHQNADVARPAGARACMPHPAHVLVAMTASERGLSASEPMGVSEELTATLNGLVDGAIYELRISLTQEPVAYVHEAIAIPSLAHRPHPCIMDKPTTLCVDIRVPWPPGIAGEVELEATLYDKFPNLAEQEVFLTSLTRTLALSSRPAEDQSNAAPWRKELAWHRHAQTDAGTGAGGGEDKVDMSSASRESEGVWSHHEKWKGRCACHEVEPQCEEEAWDNNPPGWIPFSCPGLDESGDVNLNLWQTGSRMMACYKMAGAFESCEPRVEQYM